MSLSLIAARGLDTLLCPNCHTDVGDPFWKDWMDDSYGDGAGFTLTKQTLACCGAEIGLDALKFDAHCAFGSFGIDIIDTMTDSERYSYSAL
jgi:hypothetical protein